MGSRREMTIGITINLDNYENIRLDVRGEAGSDEEANDLIMFLDSVLSRLGRDDPATAERVDHYRRRVFGSFPDAEVVISTFSSCPVTGSEEIYNEIPDRDLSGADHPDPIMLETSTELRDMSVSEDDLRIDAEEAAAMEPPVDAQIADTPSSEKGEHDLQADTPEITSNEPQVGSSAYTCDACGVEVNKVQHDVSHLFMNRTLCKKCMNQS